MPNISDFFKENPSHLSHIDTESFFPFSVKFRDDKFQSSPALDDANRPTCNFAKGKILCWNAHGMVKMIKNEDNQSSLPMYEHIILSGKGTNYNQIKIPANHPYDIASISTTDVVLGRVNNHQAATSAETKKQFTCISFKKWTKQYSWDGELPWGESLRAVHATEQFFVMVSTNNVVYVYTLGGFLVYKWSLCGLYCNGATFGDDIFSVACTLNENSPHIIDTYVYRIGVDLVLLSKCTLQLLTPNDEINTFTFTNEGILSVVTKFQFFYYSLVNSHTWSLFGRSSFEYGEKFVGISTHIVNNQIKMRCYIPSIIQNYEQYNLLDYKEVMFEMLTRFYTDNNYVNVIQNEIFFEEFKNKYNRAYKYEESTNENSQREDILLDLFMHALKNKLEILTIDIFLLLKCPHHIKSAIESASLSNQQRTISRIGEILQKRKEICVKLVDPSNLFECEIKHPVMKSDAIAVTHQNISLNNEQCREMLRQHRSSFKRTPSAKLKEINIDVDTNSKTNPKNILKNLLLKRK